MQGIMSLFQHELRKEDSGNLYFLVNRFSGWDAQKEQNKAAELVGYIFLVPIRLWVLVFYCYFGQFIGIYSRC